MHSSVRSCKIFFFSISCKPPPPPPRADPRELAFFENELANAPPPGQKKRVYLGVKTCEVFLCFVTIMFVLSFVLTSLPLLCFLCSTSLVKVIGFYTEDEPKKMFKCPVVGAQKCFISFVSRLSFNKI